MPKERTEKRFVFYRLVYRPISFPLTALAIWAGVSANALTLLNLVILLASLAALFYGTNAGLVAGACLFFLYFVLDFADGNIARYHQQSSFFGKLIDGMVDTLSFLVFPAAALGNARAGQSLLPGEWEIALGVAASFSALLRQNYRWRLAYLRAEMGLTITSPSQPDSQQAAASRLPAAVWLFENLSTCTPLLLLAVVLTGHVTLFVGAFFLLYAIGGNLETLLSIVKNRSSLRHRREH